MPLLLYVTPTDMRELYDEEMLVQATNYSDRLADQIDEVRLLAACEAGDATVDGFLLALPRAEFSTRFLETLKIHAARLAMQWLVPDDERIESQAKVSLEWLKTIAKFSRKELQNIAVGASTTEEFDPVVIPNLEFAPGIQGWTAERLVGW